MRRFNSYGPSDAKAHFTVERRELVESCVQQLVGLPEETGGHYFTIWGPRQTGKTWIMRRAIEEIRARYGDRFIVGKMSMQGLSMNADEPIESFLRSVPRLFELAFGLRILPVTSWRDWVKLFHNDESGIFDRPVLLAIDDFDALPRSVIERLVSLFREMYLSRHGYHLHGLAMVSALPLVGADSPQASPFNIQRLLQVPNLTWEDVLELFRQYQTESGQVVEPNVVAALFEATRGQPGLVGWFGELLADKYNTDSDKPITMIEWTSVRDMAVLTQADDMAALQFDEKARYPYLAEVMNLFADPNVPFVMDKPWCSYLLVNGIIDHAPSEWTDGQGPDLCRFSSPFVQMRLYLGITKQMFGGKGPLPAVPVGDALDDVFTSAGLNAPALLQRYRDYLKRMKAKGIDPWIGQPRRQDLHYTEAVGHFHLYAWLQNALGMAASVYPEFPTGNGKVDLVLRSKEHTAVIEVKSFNNMYELRSGRIQAAQYAMKLGLSTATLVVFAPTDDDAALEKLADDSVIEGTRVITVPFGWV